MRKPKTAGVVGAGTMGSGIALLCLRAGLRVILCDAQTEALRKGVKYISTHLARKKQGIYKKNLHTATVLQDLQPCEIVIEATPENFALKSEIFTSLDSVCRSETIFATNTSTLPVTALAAATDHPTRVAGMHFFNPAPVLPLVEIIRGAQTSTETTAALVKFAEILGKKPVVARDTPGFIVNRVARPFYGEALRLLAEGTATHEMIDHILERAGGFKMGPFRLMDLIGIDINFAAMKSVFEQTYGDPRYTPSLIQQQKIYEGALGRKAGRGFYDYANADAGRVFPSAPAAEAAPFSGSVALVPDTWLPGIESLLHERNMRVSRAPAPDTTAVLIGAGRGEHLRERLQEIEQRSGQGTLVLCQSVETTVHELATWMRHPERLVGIDGLFFSRGAAVSCVASPVLAESMRQQAEAFFCSLGKITCWLADSPALVVPRIVATLVNEACFAAGEDIAPPETIDKAMRLGVNYPQGPLEWGKQLGYRAVLAILEHLHSEYAETRYRPAPYLRRLARREALISPRHSPPPAA